MKAIKTLLIFLALFTASGSFAQQEAKMGDSKMKTYVIERVIPGAGDLTADQLNEISHTSCTVLKEMGPKIEWQHSYVTGDKVYCVYRAESRELIEEHARKGNFPANSISEVAAIINPATAKQ